MHAEDSGTPAQPATRRRFQFSLRTLVVVVLVYATLWAITAIWGGPSAERLCIVTNNPGQRMSEACFYEAMVDYLHDFDSRGVSPGSQRNQECYFFKSAAVAPFLLRVEWGCSLQGVGLLDVQCPEGGGVVQSSDGEGWVFWFFGYRRWLTGYGAPYRHDP